MNNRTRKLTTIAAAGLLLAAVAPLPAAAHTQVSLNVGLGLPLVAPVYVAPAPVYYTPPPPPPVVVYEPAYYGYGPAYAYGGRRVVYVDHGRRYYGPPRGYRY
ncbi:MAG: hypothetical protein QM661_10980 [Solimonas sp.]